MSDAVKKPRDITFFMFKFFFSVKEEEDVILPEALSIVSILAKSTTGVILGLLPWSPFRK